VQCRLPALAQGFLDLPAPSQGKYEGEEGGKKHRKRSASWSLYGLRKWPVHLQTFCWEERAWKFRPRRPRLSSRFVSVTSGEIFTLSANNADESSTPEPINYTQMHSQRNQIASSSSLSPPSFQMHTNVTRQLGKRLHITEPRADAERRRGTP
jgi:hypothetical protein